MSGDTDKRAGLEGLQEWFQRAVIAPWQIPGAEVEQAIVADRGPLSAADRLGIYSGSYQARLLESLRTEFPVLELALGVDLFTRFATDYLVAHPPDSYTLMQLGAGFPRHLRATRPPGDELWPEFIIELATLERVFGEVYHGEGPEGGSTPPDNATEAILREPGACRLECRFPVDRYFLAAREHLRDPDRVEAPEPPAPEPAALLIFRRDYVVQLRRL